MPLEDTFRGYLLGSSVVNKKIKAFELFDQGKSVSSPELQDLHLKNHTRHNYYWEWQKGKGVSASSSESISEAKGKQKRERKRKLKGMTLFGFGKGKLSKRGSRSRGDYKHSLITNAASLCIGIP